jgi:fimbrial isopeptide formation D2 family protein
MKKLTAILLTLALILSMSITAFAAGNGNTTMSITDGDRKYNGYQLLTLTVSLKGDEHHPEGCDGNHADDCYNYAYSVNEKYRAILQAETFANAGASLWGVNKPADASGVTDTQILEHLSKQSSDSGDAFGTLRSLADRVYLAIKTAGIAPDAESIQDTATISQGYWMFADVTDLDGENDANSLVMVDTKGETDITVAPKVAIPTIEKKVKDIDDSEDSNISDNPWHDSADHDIDGTAIPFKLTAAPPSNAAYYTTYKLIFHDTMSEGLTLDPDSIHVYIYDTKYKADVDTDLNDYVADVTDYFTITTDGLTDGCTFEVSCENVLAIPGVLKDSAFVVYYEASLNENAVIGAAGNPNEVKLEFSNNPYEEGTGLTEPDKVTVFTYQLTVNKTDSHGHALAGAGFTLYKKNVTGEYVAIGEELKVDADGNELTTFTWKGLDDGDYKLMESTVPEGYNALADVLFTISATHEENAVDPKLLSLDGGLMGTGTVEVGIIEKNIVNQTGTVLPETGAEGTFLLITASTIFVMVAVVFMVTRKKMSVYED